MADRRPLDVWTLGETMVRFTPKAHARLEEGGEWEVRSGGSESNVAVGLVRLGLRVAWASKLPKNPLGRLIARRIGSFGVDVGQVLWSDLGRAGVYFIEPGASPRPTRVLYDRAGSAASSMAPEEFDWSALDGVRHVHLSGITPALSEGCCQTVERALTEAKARGCTTSFDVNYRARLWGHAAARLALAPLLTKVDLLICTEVDARLVFQLSGGWQEVLRGLHAMAGSGAVALTLGSSGAAVYTGSDYFQATAFQVTEVDRVGAGDAFDAGLIWGFLEGDLQKGLNYGTAMAALKHTLPGDEFTATVDEVEALLESASVDIQR